LNLEKSYFDSNKPRSVHTALAEYLKMQDALTQFISSRVEHENGALKEHVTEIQDFSENYAKLNRMVSELIKQQP